MGIRYTEAILNILEPKLGYFGFKVNEKESYISAGIYEFTRQYWCASQSIIISRVEYRKDELEAAFEDGDVATEVPLERLSVYAPDYRTWLSNKYIHASLCHNNGCIGILRDGTGIGASFRQFDPCKVEALTFGARGIEKLTEWWEFSDKDTLIQRLDDIYKRVIIDGLDWFERQVADIRRYHNKLDDRRLAAIKKYR